MSGTTRWWRRADSWILSGFFGFMFATAITGPIPATADWQSPIVCASGSHLIHVEYFDEVGPTQNSDGFVSSAAKSHGFTFHCATANAESGSKTAIVLALQLVAGTLVTFLICCFFVARSAWRKRNDDPMTVGV